MSLANVILVVQGGSFVLLGTCFLIAGQWRLGLAQLLLAAVQGLIYAT